MRPAQQNRPRLGPTELIGIFFAAASVITLLACLSLWYPASALDVIWRIKPEEHAVLLRLGRPAAFGFLALFALMVVASCGAFMRSRWGWWLAFAIFLVQGLAAAARILGGAALEGWIGIGIVALILAWLTRPQIRRLFAR